MNPIQQKTNALTKTSIKTVIGLVKQYNSTTMSATVVARSAA